MFSDSWSSSVELPVFLVRLQSSAPLLVDTACDGSPVLLKSTTVTFSWRGIKTSDHITMARAMAAVGDCFNTSQSTHYIVCLVFIRLWTFSGIRYGKIICHSVEEILWCYHSNKSSLAVRSHGTTYFIRFYKMKFKVLWDFFLSLLGVKHQLK